MKKLTRKSLWVWVKRLAVYLLGLYGMAIGVVFSVKSGLGVSPVGALANVLFQIARDLELPAYINLGNCTTAVYALYILTEALILRRDFKPRMLLQLVASFLFGQLLNVATAMMAWLPAPTVYGLRLVYLLCSVPLVAAGVMLYLTPNILPTPGEGMSLAIAQKSGKSVGESKTLFDCALVILSCAVSLVYFGALVGVREGTVICALLVGFVMRQLQKPCQKALLRFVEREDKIHRALQEAGGYKLDARGKPKVIITIGREFGSGGYEIGQLLAQRLGITFYDRQLNEMASAQSGIPMSRVEEMEHHMERALIYDFKNAAYAMTNGSLSPEEELFVAQSTVIRRIAAGDESCVIMGRCADYLLYDDPNCFRLFIHARPSARIARVMRQFDLDEQQARVQMENTDKARARHYKRFTGRDYGKQEYYHLGVDSGMLGTEGSVKLILNALNTWCDVRGTHPLTLLRDKE